jgi:hypothetical protein
MWLLDGSRVWCGRDETSGRCDMVHRAALLIARFIIALVARMPVASCAEAEWVDEVFS